MINLRMTDKREDIRKWTGLSGDNHDKSLWEVGFDLDDWDVCFESDKRLVKEYNDGDVVWSEPIAEAWWLVTEMSNYCVGYTEVEYNGKWYYTVHHS